MGRELKAKKNVTLKPGREPKGKEDERTMIHNELKSMV